MKNIVSALLILSIFSLGYIPSSYAGNKCKSRKTEKSCKHTKPNKSLWGGDNGGCK